MQPPSKSYFLFLNKEPIIILLIAKPEKVKELIHLGLCMVSYERCIICLKQSCSFEDDSHKQAEIAYIRKKTKGKQTRRQIRDSTKKRIL